MNKKSLLALTFGLGLIAQPLWAATIDATDPCKLAVAVADATFDELNANRSRLSDRNYTRQLVTRQLMPWVDVRYAAYRVLGSELQKTSAEERTAFSEAFGEYVVNSFADVMSKYGSQELVVPRCGKIDPAATQHAEKFLVRESGKQDYEVVFKLRKNAKTGEWKAFDLVAENVSMLSTKTSELQPIIKKDGVGAAIRALKENSGAAGK